MNKSYKVCTCLTGLKKKPFKYRKTEEDSEGKCVDCGYYAVSIPGNVLLSEVNEFLCIRGNAAVETEDDVTYSIDMPYRNNYRG